jgi:hypothetical protein
VTHRRSLTRRRDEFPRGQVALKLITVSGEDRLRLTLANGL